MIEAGIPRLLTEERSKEAIGSRKNWDCADRPSTGTQKM